MKITKREKFLLGKSLGFPVSRYILVKSRYQGLEKAEMHIEIARIIFEFINYRKSMPEDFDNIMSVHDDLTIITDHMDKYGFNMDEEMDTYSISKEMVKDIVRFVGSVKENKWKVN